MSMPETDVAELIRNVNATNNAVEDQCLRTRQAADAAIRSARAAEEAEAAAEPPGSRTRPSRPNAPGGARPCRGRSPLRPGTVALDGVACYFAAQALGGSQDSTLVWTVLFLAVLASGEVALDFYRDRNLRAWQILAFITSAFVACSAFSGSGSSPPSEPTAWSPAFTGAALFTAATAGFLALGYRALRAAETPQAWRARRAAHAARQAARTAQAAAERDAGSATGSSTPT